MIVAAAAALGVTCHAVTHALVTNESGTHLSLLSQVSGWRKSAAVCKPSVKHDG